MRCMAQWPGLFCAGRHSKCRARDWARALVDSMTVPEAATCYNGVEDPDDKNIPYTNINIGPGL